MDPISLTAKSAAAPQMVHIATPMPQPANDRGTTTAPNGAAQTLTSVPSQTAQTARSNLAASPQEPSQPKEPPRTLLPYGVTMLPDGKPNSPSTFAEPTHSPPTDPAPNSAA